MGGRMRGGGGGQMLDRVNFVFFEDALLRRNDFILLLLFFFEFLRRTCGSKANGFVPLFYTLFLNGRFFFSVSSSFEKYQSKNSQLLYIIILDDVKYLINTTKIRKINFLELR